MEQYKMGKIMELDIDQLNKELKSSENCSRNADENQIGGYNKYIMISRKN